MIRRKLTDRSLARRMKQLVKQWQRLLQSPTTPNGPVVSASTTANGIVTDPEKTSVNLSSRSPPLLAPHVHSSSSSLAGKSSNSPIPHSNATVSTVSTSPVPIPTPSPAPPRQTDPAAKRRKMLQMFSKVKTQTPQIPGPMSTQQPETQLHAQSQAPPSVHPTTLANSVSHTDSSSGHPTSSASHNSSSSLTLSLPLISQLRPQHDRNSHLKLVVSVPRCAVTLEAHCDRSGKLLAYNNVNEHKQEHETALPDAEKPLSLIVSVTTSVLHRHPPPLPGQELDDLTAWDTLASETVSTSRSREMPEGSVVGVDGCLGRDGLWYEWTEYIPGEELSVTVLPYVYIDGVEPVDCL